MENEKKNPRSDNIDLLMLLQKLWRERQKVTIITIVSTIFGIIFSLLAPAVYTASSTFIPKGDSQNSIGGNLSGLASLAGINLNSLSSSQSGIPLQLYPRLVRSNPFVESLLKINIPQNGTSISLMDYILKQQSLFGFYLIFVTCYSS